MISTAILKRNKLFLILILVSEHEPGAATSISAAQGNHRVDRSEVD